DFMLRKASSKEIDIILNMIKYTDWDNVLRVSERKLARDSGTTLKYVKEVINRFSSVHKNKRIITKNMYSEEYPYKLLIGKSSVLYNNDQYAKRYSFLYTDKFMKLTIYEKRIILSAIMNMSVSGQNTVFLKVSDFVYRTEVS